MKENREQYKEKITKEITRKLNLDFNKIYSIEEINQLLDKHKMKGNYLVFEPTKPHTAQKIIDTLVFIDLCFTDAIHKEMGIYEDKEKCQYCEKYFSEGNIYQVNIEHLPCICHSCRRKNKIKINFGDFARLDNKEEFIQEEYKYGLDYSDYIERLNKTKKQKDSFLKFLKEK